MARVVLDTSALIAIDRDLAEAKNLFSAGEDYYLPEVVVAEYLTGVENSRTPQQRSRKLQTLRTIEEVCTRVDFGRSQASSYAKLASHLNKIGRRRSEFDLAIAACALSLDAQIKTSDRAAKFEELPGITVSYF
jgi:predicted nucleic acid-binding protein